jgi:DNA-binding protein HU-beta
MTYSDLFSSILKTTGVGKKHIGEILAAFCGEVENMKVGEKLTVPGFGTFKMVEVAARKSRNPRTGEPIEVPAKVELKFKQSKKA